MSDTTEPTDGPEQHDAPEQPDLTPATDKPVHEAVLDVMSTVRSVSKDGYNDHGGFNFRGIDAVMNAVGPALRQHRVLVRPRRVLEHTLASRARNNGGAMNYCTVRVEYVFVGPRGDELAGEAVGESFDSGDKSTPKAMSVAFRTFLLQSLTLPTDEPDPDLDTYTAPVPSMITLAVARKRIAQDGLDLDGLRDFWREARDDGAGQDVLDHIAEQAEAARQGAGR